MVLSKAADKGALRRLQLERKESKADITLEAVSAEQEDMHSSGARCGRRRSTPFPARRAEGSAALHRVGPSFNGGLEQAVAVRLLPRPGDHVGDLSINGGLEQEE